MADCRTCELIERRDRGEAPPWDAILRTPAWDLVHAYGTSIAGWLCLVVRRHVTAVADLTDAEASELGPLVRDVSRAVQRAAGCPKTYVVQFAEQAEHPHVHFHVIPRPADLEDDKQGPRVFAFLGVPPQEEVPEQRRNDIADAVRKAMP